MGEFAKMFVCVCGHLHIESQDSIQSLEDSKEKEKTKNIIWIHTRGGGRRGGGKERKG